MTSFFRRLPRLFQVEQSIPIELADNFRHYYWDITWYGLLNGTVLSFLNYFAVRMGATSTQVGIITAIPAVVSLFLALPAGVILQRHSVNHATFITAVLSRIFYLIFILLPFVKSSEWVISLIMLVTLIMTIPAVFSNVGFNTSFAMNIPDQYRAHVAGVRNAAFAIVTIFVSLLSGIILEVVKFPYGYAIVFAIGFIGSLLSAYHLHKLKAITSATPGIAPVEANPEQSVGAEPSTANERPRIFKDLIRLDLIKGRTGLLIFLLTMVIFALFVSAPVFPIYLVNRFHFSDQVLSIGMASFNFSIFLASLNLEAIEHRMGRKKAIGFGFILMSTFPATFLFMSSPIVYYVANLVSGLGSALTNGEIYNYLYERIPSRDHGSAVAWFTLTSNIAVLAGATLGPLIANSFSFGISVLILTAIRFIVSLAILRWG